MLRLIIFAPFHALMIIDCRFMPLHCHTPFAISRLRFCFRHYAILRFFAITPLR